MAKSSYSEWNNDAIKRYVKRATDAREIFLNEINPAAAGVLFSTNSKLSGVLAVGTLPVIDCSGACKDCKNGCYAVRHTVGRSTQALNRCARNSALLALNRDKFFQDIENEAKFWPVFRYNTEGEIADADYFRRAVAVAGNCPNTTFLIFTKRHDIVNKFIADGGKIPANLRVILSAWKDIAQVNNPYKFPISAPDFSNAPEKYRAPFNPYGAKVVECCGDCFKCFRAGAGCFGAQSGDVIRFEAH